MKSFKWTLIISIIFAALYVSIFLGLVFWPFSGGFDDNRIKLGKWQAEQEAIGVDSTQDTSYRESTFLMRDGETLYARRYGENKDAVIIFIHGVAGDSSELNRPPGYPVYSYSAIASAQPNPPEDASVALAAVKAPVIILVGADDEVFDAGKYQPLAEANPETKTVILPGLNHNSVLNSHVTHEKVGQWLESL